MRKHIARIAILAVLSTGFISIASAAPASAANCTFGFTPVIYTSQVWRWDGTAQNCTGVNAVEFRNAASTACCYMVDQNYGTVHFSYAGGGIAYSPYYPGVGAGQYYSHYYNTIWGPGCGQPGTPFWVAKIYQARIHNVNNGGSWGGWYNLTSPNEPIC